MRRTVIPPYIDTLSSVVRRAVTLVRGLAFWTAVLLPMLYLPPLVLGYSAVVDPPALGALIAVNVVAIVVGHGHGRTTADEVGRRR